jgi:hypothetical protein
MKGSAPPCPCVGSIGAPLPMYRECHFWEMVPCPSLWGITILVEGKRGSPPPYSMGQLSQIGLVMFDHYALASL